jgi:hypothetical protein
MTETITIERLTEASYHKPKKFFKLQGKTDGEKVEALSNKEAVEAALKPYLDLAKSTHENWVNYKVNAEIGVRVTGDSIELLDGTPSVPTARAKRNGARTLADLEMLAEWAAKTAYRTGDAFKDNPEALQAWASTLFIQTKSADITAGGEDYPPELEDDGDSSLPF